MIMMTILLQMILNLTTLMERNVAGRWRQLLEMGFVVWELLITLHSAESECLTELLLMLSKQKPLVTNVIILILKVHPGVQKMMAKHLAFRANSPVRR